MTASSQKLTLQDLKEADVRGRRVIVRVDYNVPLDDQGGVADDTRIQATLPTLRQLVALGGRLVLLSHFGRPKGKRVPEMSLRPASDRLSQLLGSPVRFVDETTGSRAVGATHELRNGEALLLENTRFDPREEANDPSLAAEMAELGDLYVNDAFGAAHRAHASTVGVAERMKAAGGLAAAGLLMKRELDYLGAALESPARPFVAVLGGAKISGKIDVIESLLPKTDALLIGGAMANTFFRAQGLATGSSLVEEDRLDMALELLGRAGDKLMLPEDVVIARKPEPNTETHVADIRSAVADGGQVGAAGEPIGEGWMALDIGPKTVAKYRRTLVSSRTILWNGPMGVAEIPEFRAGTEGVAKALAEATQNGAVTVVGGGDSAAALTELGLQDAVSHVSTGGGASLEFLEGKVLPGVQALSDRR